jgi:hypothetical protein
MSEANESSITSAPRARPLDLAENIRNDCCRCVSPLPIQGREMRHAVRGPNLRRKVLPPNRYIMAGPNPRSLSLEFNQDYEKHNEKFDIRGGDWYAMTTGENV